MLSDGEYVVNARATAKHRALLEAINSGRVPAFAHGGSVGGGDNVTRIMPAANGNSPAVTVNAPITVNGSAGTPEQNDDLARRMSKQLEATVRGTVANELRRQMRPGNLLNSRGFGPR
jgi:hypothetical protein